MANKKSRRKKSRRPEPRLVWRLDANAFVVRPPRDARGRPRVGGKVKYAQLAILNLYGGIPQDASPSRLAREITDWLAHKDRPPSCRAIGKIGPDTVRRALKLLVEANK
jgi:hypothetical protein